jgi:hypothetical protein
MRLLVIGSKATGSLESAYARSLSRLELCQVEFLNIDKEKIELNLRGLVGRAATRALAQVSRRRIENECARFLANQKGKYDAILIFKGSEFSRSTLESYRSDQPNAVWINLNPDDPFSSESGSSNSHIKDCISFFDLYLSWSRQVTSRLTRSGCRRAEYLPFGYDPEVHLPPERNTFSQGQYFSFVGAWDKQREALLEALAAFDVRVFGSSWNRVSKRSPLFPKIVARNIYGKDLARVTFHAKASFNLLRPQNFGAHNMRTFEIPAMAGLMLTTRSSEQQEYFPENEACLMFDSIDELRDRIAQLLTDGKSANAMRMKANQLVQNHSYTERARTLIKLANAI